MTVQNSSWNPLKQQKILYPPSNTNYLYPSVYIIVLFLLYFSCIELIKVHIHQNKEQTWKILLIWNISFSTCVPNYILQIYIIDRNSLKWKTMKSRLLQFLVMKSIKNCCTSIIWSQAFFFYFYFFFSDTETLYPFLIMTCKWCFLFLLLEMLFSDGKGTALTTYLQLPARLNQGGSQLIVTFNM